MFRNGRTEARMQFRYNNVNSCVNFLPIELSGVVTAIMRISPCFQMF